MGWQEEATSELLRITGPGSTKKRRTILAVVEAKLTPGMSVEDALRLPETCSRNIFYNKWRGKDEHGNWIDPLFVEVLQNVEDLAMRWQTAEEARRLKERQQQHQEAMLDIVEKGIGKLKEMVLFPVVDRRMEDGTLVLAPRFTWNEFSRLLATVDKHGRLALEMATEKTAAEISGPNEGPIQTQQQGAAIFQQMDDETLDRYIENAIELLALRQEAERD